jgi:hypothetical protein
MASPSREDEFLRSKAFMVFMIDRALEDRLITHQDVVDGITVDELAKRLPKPELGKIIQRALENAHSKMAFTEMDLLRAMPVSQLVDYVPLTHLWDKVMLPRVSERHNYVALDATPPGAESGVEQAAPASNEGFGADDVLADDEESTASRISIADELDILEVQDSSPDAAGEPARRPASGRSGDGWSALDRRFDDRSGIKRPAGKPVAAKPKASTG